MSIRTTTHTATPATALANGTGVAVIALHAAYVIFPSCILEPIPILELTYAFNPYQSLIFNPTPTDDVELPIFEYA